jgi:glycerophosphoryl diester phosphodiesterase
MNDTGYNLPMIEPRHVLAIACIIIGIACGSPDTPPESLGAHDLRFPPGSLVAHALGGIEGVTYTNSLEALEHSLARGSRFLEVDLSFTADGDLVCFHTKHEEYLGLETPIIELSTSEFLDRRYHDRFTLISLETLMQRLEEHPEAYLVTDCKHDFNDCMEKVVSVAKTVDPALVGRIIPQFYTVEQWRDVTRMESEHGAFATVIFTLYRTKIDDDTVVEIAASRAVPVITMSRERFNRELVARLEAIGIDSLVHTINNPAEMVGYIDQGVRGLYSDRFVTWGEVLAVAQPVTSPPLKRSEGAVGDLPRE